MSHGPSRPRALDSARDSVEVVQATPANLEANANLRVGAGDVGPGNPVPVEQAPGEDWTVNIPASVQVTDGGSSLTVDGTVSIGAGYSAYRALDLNETEEEVKGSAGTVHGWWLYNASASVVYVKLYNALALNVTVGTTTPLVTLAVPAGAAANVELVRGIAFSTAITIAATTGRADNDVGAPAADDVLALILYA